MTSDKPGREEAVERMAREVYERMRRGNPSNWTWEQRSDAYRELGRREMRLALAALIEPTTETCPECEGEGFYLAESTLPTADVAHRCPKCNGAGTVPGPPLAYLAGDLEQVGWAFSAVDKPQRCYPWAFSDLRFDDVGEAVYRVVTSEEEER